MTNKHDDVSLTIVTGLSGSGITTAINALEDIGVFCVENIPPSLIRRLIDLARSAPDRHHLAVGLNARVVEDAGGALALLAAMPGWNVRAELIYLEACDDALLRRFSETRRPHPFGAAGVPVPEAIRAERQAMHPCREVAGLVIDTSDINVHDCKKRTLAFFAGDRSAGLTLSVMSFGFRHGVPPEADIVWDVRFLPNPHFVDTLRPMSGRDPAVRDYVLNRTETQEFLQHFLPLLKTVLPRYQREGKSYLTVAIGCTGGRHRSVAIAEWIAEQMRTVEHRLTLRHRDADRGTT